MFFQGMVKGLSVTLKHFIQSYTGNTGIREGVRIEDPTLGGMFTVQYPEEKLPMYPRFRGALMHLRDPETGMHNCTACGACVQACPQDCLTVEGDEGKGKERRAATFTYELSRCIFCGLCVEACNFDAIEMSPDYELASGTGNIVWDLDRLLAQGDKYAVRESEKDEIK
ncbi:MAG: NADH-quinone oxidoreductase subunit I [Chloroflexota bacterium]|nr:MAG: NADH-quinone oxidoreductase subunit I [Chloroflexota bacterium]